MIPAEFQDCRWIYVAAQEDPLCQALRDFAQDQGLDWVRQSPEHLDVSRGSPQTHLVFFSKVDPGLLKTLEDLPEARRPGRVWLTPKAPEGLSTDPGRLWVRTPRGSSTEPAWAQEVFTRGLGYHRWIRDSEAARTERIRTEFDLGLARRVQESFLPGKDLDLPGFEIRAYWKPCRELGGDFYDLYTTDLGRAALFLADVSGKGLPAALFTAFLKAQWQHWAVGLQSDHPEDIFADANRALSELFSATGHFVTAQMLLFERGLHRLRFLSAGHPAPFVFNPSHEPQPLDFGQLPLGLQSKTQYQSLELPFPPGSSLVLLSDGILEEPDAAGNLLGRERFQAALAKVLDHPSDSFFPALFEALGLDPEAGAHDDRTLILVRSRGI